ncbi:hypothetical protein NM208_g5819 [Fusarium decemcellulare]|uniref:Uncharacterized protein n=1 Tax=Fusarium decemcellulare TaxID=57161 RepID=A0ACC1SFI1_9HYPO|nr:hypothetical protein NM208_g5819 [Fusarium decemcellulare]
MGNRAQQVYVPSAGSHLLCPPQGTRSTKLRDCRTFKADTVKWSYWIVFYRHREHSTLLWHDVYENAIHMFYNDAMDEVDARSPTGYEKRVLAAWITSIEGAFAGRNNVALLPQFVSHHRLGPRIDDDHVDVSSFSGSTILPSSSLTTKMYQKPAVPTTKY